MTYLWLTLNWLMTLLFLVFAVPFGFSDPIAAVPLILIAALFAPPIHRVLQRLFGSPPSPKAKSVLTLVLLIAFVFALVANSIQEGNKRAAALAVEQAAQAEATRQKHVSEFNAKRDTILAEAKAAIQEKRFSDVLTITRPYNDINDVELRQLYASATTEISAIRQAEAREKKRLNDLARRKEIVAELSKVSTQDIKRNFELYTELAALAPDDPKVREKAEYYRKRHQEQEERARMAAQKLAKEAEEKARAEKAINDQFSSWDGSHRNLEKWIKTTMHNPDSYKHVETKYRRTGDHLLVSTTFRGTNGFGGIVTNTVWAKTDLQGDIVEILKSGP